MTTVLYAAPGRINLIGEHTDYNLGWALPIALPWRTVVTFEPSDADAVTVRSDYVDGSARIPLNTKPGDVTGWASYVAGVVWSLRSAGHPVPGGRMWITSEIPMGSGLSSSAALECAALGALSTAAGVRIDRIDQALIAQRAENDYVGAPTGLLDQLSALFGEDVDGAADRFPEADRLAGGLRPVIIGCCVAADRLPGAAWSRRRRIRSAPPLVRAGGG